MYRHPPPVTLLARCVSRPSEMCFGMREENSVLLRQPENVLEGFQ
jgi:hypothetical protein